MSELGSATRPLRIAIVGCGPSGFYAAEALTRGDIKTQVDMFDRLPAPYGLVRYGVAPDHAKIKSVIKVYEKTIAKENISFIGNVAVGKDLGVAELKKYYDVILFTCGAETDRKLAIPGIEFAGSHTATEFVAWYNGRPEYRERKFDLSGEVAVIIGQGNVAMDVSRILCKSVEELKATDIAQHALEALAKSNIKEVHMIGRRGPAQAAFTPVEIREFGELNDCDAIVRTEDLKLNEASQKELEDLKNAPKKKNYEILTHLAAEGNKSRKKKFVCHFLKSPLELKGNGKIQRLVLEENQLSGNANDQKAKGTGKKEEMRCDLFFRSVGYSGIPIEGVAFDKERGIFANEGGRIKGDPQLYCAGWIKRGPSGVIGTNKPDAEETVAHIFADVPKLTPCVIPDTNKLLAALKAKGVYVVNLEDWKKIDAAEIANGAKVGKPREKFVRVEDMLKVLA